MRARRGHWGEVVRADDPLRDRLSSPATRGHVAVAARYEGLGLAATRPQRKMRDSFTESTGLAVDPHPLWTAVWSTSGAPSALLVALVRVQLLFHELEDSLFSRRLVVLLL